MKKKLTLLTLIFAAGILSLTSCKKEGCIDVNADNYDTEAKKDDGSCTYPTINMGNNNSGDISGNGGSASSSKTFTQNSATLGWDMSINASAGSFNLTVTDADGTAVINQTLTANSGPQSADGTSPAGTTGTWTATVTLTEFNGIGDYSFQ